MEAMKERGITLWGEVTGGNKLGRRLGFPTANLTVNKSFAAADGVYAARVTVEGKIYDAMANLGYKPSVSDGGKRVLEANLFGFEGDLYGRTIGIELLDFIRPEMRFDSFGALREALARDRETIVEVFRKKRE